MYMSMFVMGIRSSNTAHPECNLHHVVTSLSIKLKRVNVLEAGKIKPRPAQSNDLMNQTGLSKGGDW